MFFFHRNSLLELHLHSASLRPIPEVSGRGDPPLQGPGGASNANAGHVEGQSVGLPAHLRTPWGRTVGMVSSRCRVSMFARVLTLAHVSYPIGT